MAPEIDPKFVTTLKAARGGKPMQFAFLAKGPGGTLLADKKLPPKTVADAKKEQGSSTVLRGRLVGENGTLVFEVVKEPPGTLLAQLKKALKDQAGLTWAVEVRVKADAEAELPEGESEEAPPGREQVMARLQALATPVKAALAGPNAARVQALLGEVNGLVKNDDFAQAGKVLDELEPLVKAAPTSSAGAAVEWGAKLAEYQPTIKAALAAKGPNAAEIAKLFTQAGALAKPGGDMAQALAHLERCYALARAAAPSGGATPPPDLAPWTAARAQVIAQLKEIAKEIAAAKHAESNKALIELNAVMKNLTAEPKTRQQVTELERYLAEDDVVLDVSEFAEDIRTPLLTALGQIKTQLPA